jgi:NADP-dependent 3-hydroxy acid dehydrogenase YdfG
MDSNSVSTLCLPPLPLGELCRTNFQVNNAGTGGGGTPYEKLDEWHTTLNVNLFGVVNGVQTFTQAMLDQGERTYCFSGHSVNFR